LVRRIGHLRGAALAIVIHLLQLACIVALMGRANAANSFPRLYSELHHEGPLRAQPDDLLLLPGDNLSGADKIVYRAIADGNDAPALPDGLPVSSTADFGLADVVNALGAPYALTVHLPQVLRPDGIYALWAVDSAGGWSNPVRINDARPLWFTPDEIALRAGSRADEVLKIVGRNLEPLGNRPESLRLQGNAASYLLTAADTTADNPELRRHVARFALPAHLRPGSYQVALSRDGVHWLGLDGHLQVLATGPVPRFTVGDYMLSDCGTGTCRAVPGRCTSSEGDITACIVAAIAAASKGGMVHFPRGTFVMADRGRFISGALYSDKGVSQDGIIVPPNVGLEGEGAGNTRLVRGLEWEGSSPSFILQGHNEISDLTFTDSHRYQPKDYGPAILSLGLPPGHAKTYSPSAPTSVSHVRIHDNVFDKPYIGVGASGLPIDHLRIVDNEFGAYATGVMIEGNAWDVRYRYQLRDSVISGNVFYPGSYLDTSIRQGTMASSISGGTRVDFSDNFADGSSARFLYQPQSDAKGWRAGFFWVMHDNIEMTLVSGNRASCTGDKAGDGEAIAFDNNHNRQAFEQLAVRVISAESTPQASRLIVEGDLSSTQDVYGRSINVDPHDYYLGDWLQVVEGVGVGQARKINAINPRPSEHRVEFSVTPAFDVTPRGGSRVLVGRSLWQTLVVGNTVDQRTPLCQKSNRTRRAGGMITLYAQAVDSVVDGNSQFDTSGITLAQQYELVDPAVGVQHPIAFSQAFNEVLGNKIIGAYDREDVSPLEKSGIALEFAATPHTAPPPVLSYGVTVAHNQITNAAGPKGSISLNQGWFTGPLSSTLAGTTPWRMADNTLLFSNEISATDARIGHGPAIGISAGSAATPIEWRTTLANNDCKGIPLPQMRLRDEGTQTMRYCPGAAQTCECEREDGAAQIAMQVQRRSSPGGDVVTVQIALANEGTTAASAVTLALAATGSDLIAVSPFAGSCDVSAGICRLSTLEAGGRRMVEIDTRPHAGETASLAISLAYRGTHRPLTDSVVIKLK
jgi:hypothetical protein